MIIGKAAESSHFYGKTTNMKNLLTTYMLITLQAKNFIFLKHLYTFFIAVLVFSAHFPIAKKICCNNEISAATMKKWTKYFAVFWLFNIIGEAIPQLIIRYISSAF